MIFAVILSTNTPLERMRGMTRLSVISCEYNNYLLTWYVCCSFSPGNCFMEESKINKDLILRERLAIERTVMANQRTFLSFLRTALYFSIAGLTVNELLVVEHEAVIVAVFFLISFLLLIAGIATYLYQRKKVAKSRRQVGGNVELEEE